MAYTTTDLITLAHLKALAERAESTYAKQADLDTIESTVDTLVEAGGESNVIESISVNGTVQEITDKNVDITVPTTVSSLTNDSDYQTGDEVDTAIATAIAAAGHASYLVTESIPDADEAEENVLYLVMNSDTGYYDIYALINGAVLLIDDTSVDLTDYVTTTALEELLADYASTSDIASDDEVSEMLDEIYGTSEE